MNNHKLHHLIISTVFALFYTCAANASEGTGTAGFCERHGCGAPEDPGTVTECPDLVCPDVTCQATDCSKTTVVVNPTPCPAPTFPNYLPCRRLKNGTLRCPRKATPRRVFAPEGRKQ